MAAAAGRGAAVLHEGFLRYRRFRWLKLASLVCVVAVAAYALDDATPRPGGGTALGYALGTLTAGLVLWLTALGIRKRAIGRAGASLKAWTSAHVYLGLATVTLATLHAGFQFGWNVHSLAYALLVVVVGSGIWGIVVYARLPRALAANRGELTETQMIEGLRTLDRQLHDAAQPLDSAHSEVVRLSLDHTTVAGGLWARLSGRAPRCGTRRALDRLNAELRAGVADPGGSFARVAALLERKAAALQQARRHARLRALLEVWLYVHVPATFALIAAIAAHVFSVFYYW